MRYILIIELIGYFGIIWLQGIWYQRRELTENRFALYQVTYLSLLILTAFVYYSSVEYVINGAILSTLCWIIGYPVAKWIYRQSFPPK